MKVAEAESIAREKLDTRRYRFDRISESANYFIFGVMPIDSDDEMDRPMIPPIGVHKKTGQAMPFSITTFPEEFKKMKRIR